MYEENENKINWSAILKKAGIAIGIILIILGIVTLVGKCTKKDEIENPNNGPVDLTRQLDSFEAALLSYLDKDNLPLEINASKTIRLKILISKNLVSNIVDSNNNTCDVNESYAEVTRLENNYAAKISLICGNNKDYRIIYVGCFEECNGGVCKGTENSTNGVCTITTNNPDNNNDNETENNNGNNNSNNGNNSTTTKPNNSTTKKPTTNSTVKTTTKKPTTTTSKPKQVLYEYKQCTREKVCLQGSMNNGRCEKLTFYTEYGTVIKNGGISKPITVPAEKVLANTSVTDTAPLTPQEVKNLINGIKNTDLKVTTYTFKKMASSGKSIYTKTVKTYKYKCSVGNPVNGGKFCTTTETTPVTYSCSDPISFKYNPITNKCTRRASKIEYFNPVDGQETCKYTWSNATSLAGWVRTGRTK